MEKPMYYITDWMIQPGNYQFDTHRFPQAYIELMPWFALNWKDVATHITGTDNIIFVNTPVGNEYEKLLIVEQLLPNNKVIMLQEGHFESVFEEPANVQELYIGILSKCTAFMCSVDVAKVARIFTDKLVHGRICTNTVLDAPRGWGGDYVFIPAPTKAQHKGMIAHKIVYDTVPRDIPVYSMRYKRPSKDSRLPDAYKMPGFNLWDPCTPEEWLQRVYNCKFGIELVKDWAGGNNVMEFGGMGIPLIGNISLQPQYDVFPDLSFEYYDVDGVKNAIHLLLNDIDFYNDVCKKAYDRVISNWNSAYVVEEFKQNLKPFLS